MERLRHQRVHPAQDAVYDLALDFIEEEHSVVCVHQVVRLRVWHFAQMALLEVEWYTLDHLAFLQSLVHGPLEVEVLVGRFCVDKAEELGDALQILLQVIVHKDVILFILEEIYIGRFDKPYVSCNSVELEVDLNAGEGFCIVLFVSRLTLLGYLLWPT